MIKICKKAVSLFLVSVFVFGFYQLSDKKTNTVSAESLSNTEITASTSSEYEKYLAGSGIKDNAKDSIEISAADFNSDSQNITIDNEKIKWNSAEGKANANINVSEDGLYNIAISYRHFGETSSNIELKLLIDGKVCFDDCNSLSLNRFWKDATDKPQVDNEGNEFSAEQIEIDEFRKAYLRDETGVVIEPYLFALTKGEHNISIELTEGVAEIEKVILAAPENTKSYKDVKNEYDEKGYEWYTDKQPIIIEGEDAAIKSDKAIVSKADKSTANIRPNNAFNSVINNIGGDNWAAAGDSVVWKINVEKSGIYKLDFRYQQRGVINGVTYRSLLVDGKSPFNEAKVISFPYTTGWSTKTFANEKGEPYGVYLEKGEHEIELVCTLGPVADLYKRLEEIVSSVGDRYLDIIMITGETPDANRDYELFKQIPDFNKSLEADRKALLKLANDSEKLSGVDGNQTAASFRNMARVLKSMIDNKYTAHKYVTDYYSNYNTISAWLSDMCSMPLSIDSIELSSKEHKAEKLSNGFESFWFGAKRFLASFTKDYITEEDDEEYDLRLWVNWGRDQSQILNSLIENKFTPETGIKVKLEIVGTSVINGILSGNAPDLSLQLPRSSPVNLAMRGALVDLTEFEDFEEVTERFQPTATTPYYYNGGCYALPDTQTFMVMFYRKDVLDKLELDVPKTWEEFTEASVKIMRNNMQVYLPYTRMNGTTVADAGVGSLSLFPTLLIQNNVDIYNKELNLCNLDSAESISIFENWTTYYTEYIFMKEANFYNRFRLGTMPLGISPYTLYTQIVTAAPEIADKWGVAMLPGTVNENGQVNHSASGAGTGAGILKISKHKEEAWEFLKWWTRADTQYMYSENIEAVLGPTGRVATANVEAFSNLSWNKEDKQILLEQWNSVEEINEVPGSYYLARSIDQAFWEVMNGNNTPKEALIKWTEAANAEIERKINEYK